MLGRSVGNYRLISKIGQGGMGVVYLAQHKTLGRRAAVKVLVPELSSNQDIVARFFNEARATTAIRNPGIVEVFDFGFLDDRSAYIIMEYLDGESLAARIRKGRPKVVATLVVLRAIARSLQAAHELGIVHRDLKPDNVFLVPDADLPSGERIKLLDFGIAKLNAVMGQTGHTRTGTVMGTPTYMAPEQCRGAGSVDHRADLYALGCIAYEMLCGQPPFVAEGAGEIIARHLYFEPAPPRTLRASLRPEVEELVLRLLQKDPAARPSTATEVVHVIDRLVATAPTVAPRIEPADPPVVVRRRRSEPVGVPAVVPVVVDGRRHESADPAHMAAAGRPRSEPADPSIALDRRREEPLAPTVPAGRARSEPEDPPLALDRRREEPLAPTVPAGRPRSEPGNPAAARRHSEPLEQAVIAGRRGSEPMDRAVAAASPRGEPWDPSVDIARRPGVPLDPPVAAARPRDEPLEPAVASGRRRSEPLAPAVASGRRRSEPLEPVLPPDRPSEPSEPAPIPDRPRAAPADRQVAVGRRHNELSDPVPASYRRLSESLDLPNASPRLANMDTTLSGAVVSDVNTSAPTVLRSRFSRNRIAMAVGAGLVVLLAVVTWTRASHVPEPAASTPANGSAISNAVGASVAPAPPRRGSATPEPDGTDTQPPVVTLQPAPPPASPLPGGVLPGASDHTPSPETRDDPSGPSRNSTGRSGGLHASEKPVDGATPSDGGSASAAGTASPAPGRHTAPRSPQKGKTGSTAKPATTTPPPASGNPAPPESSTPPPAASPTPGKPADASITAPQLSCTVGEKGAGPGEKFQVQCDAINANESATVITSVEVAVGTYRTKTAVGPAWPEIPAHGSLPFSVTPTLPRDVLPGSSVSVTVTVNTRDSASVQQQVQVPIH